MSQTEPFWRISEWIQMLSKSEQDSLRQYHSLLCKWTKKINLISPSTLVEADRIHFADSLLGIEVFKNQIPENSEVWDLGSGNGFPGIILSIMRPDCKVKCVDSDERKMSFVNQVALQLKTPNLQGIKSRIEELRVNSISFATTRALGEVTRVLSLCESSSRSSAMIFHFKGLNWEKELAEAQKCSTWNTSQRGNYKIPLEETSERTILCSIKK